MWEDYFEKKNGKEKKKKRKTGNKQKHQFYDHNIQHYCSQVLKSGQIGTNRKKNT